MVPVKSKNKSQYAHLSLEKPIHSRLPTAAFIPRKDTTIPNFLGMTLKESIQEAKLTGLAIKSVGASGRVVWQSAKPGEQVHKSVTCQIKLESM